MESSPAVERQSTDYEKKMLKLSRIRTILLLVMAAALVAVALFAFSFGSQINRILYQAEDTFVQLNVIAADINASNLPEMFGEINVLVEQGQVAAASAATGAEKAFSTLEEIDVETLNKSIQDLHAVIEPLSRFFKR